MVVTRGRYARKLAQAEDESYAAEASHAVVVSLLAAEMRERAKEMKRPGVGGAAGWVTGDMDPSFPPWKAHEGLLP